MNKAQKKDLHRQQALITSAEEIGNKKVHKERSHSNKDRSHRQKKWVKSQYSGQ